MRSSAAPCAALACLFLAAPGRAQAPPNAAKEPGKVSAPAATASDSTPAERVVVPADPAEPVFAPIPDAHDTLRGHLALGGSVGVKWPFGSLDANTSQRSRLGPALALNLDLGFGLGRNLVLGAWGELDEHSAPPDCPLCSAQSFAGGPFLRYHLVQGTRFDPWGALAVGVRSTSVDNGNGTTGHFFGAELLNLRLGGDWYPWSNVGIGPYAEFDLGAYSGSTHHTGLGTGIRLALDLPGK